LIIKLSFVLIYLFCKVQHSGTVLTVFFTDNRDANPRARWMAAGLPADRQRAQSGPVPCSGAKRRGMALDEVSAAIPGGGAAGNKQILIHSPFTYPGFKAW